MPEPVLISHDSSFYTLGMEFDPAGEYAGCRLCGAVYQSPLDREVLHYIYIGQLQILVEHLTKEVYFKGEEKAVRTYHKAKERRNRWRELHAKRYHSEEEITRFTKTGMTLTPEAAYKLAPLGFAPIQNDLDVIAAMAEAPRAPLEDCES